MTRQKHNYNFSYNGDNNTNQSSEIKHNLIQLNSKHRKEITPTEQAQWDFTIDLVEQVINKRQLMQLSQVQLAHKAGVARSTIARLESWQYTNLSFSVIFKILDVLDLKLKVVDNTLRNE